MSANEQPENCAQKRQLFGMSGKPRFTIGYVRVWASYSHAIHPPSLIAPHPLDDADDARKRYKTHAGNTISCITFTMSPTYEAEKQVAIAAVRRACALTASVFNKLVKNETLTKDDKSPVTGM